jgi:murein hydrolase activator
MYRGNMGINKAKATGFSNNSAILFFTNRWGFVCFFMLSLLICNGAYAQKNRSQLEKEKKQSLQKIAETNKILQETTNEKKASLGQLAALNQQISARSERIKVMTREVQLLSQDINELSQIIFSMENDLTNYRKEYAAMIYAASKANNSYNTLVFIFSSATFHQLVMRIHYLQQYAEARKIQVAQIQKIKSVLTVQRTKLNEKSQEKNTLLQELVQENNQLIVLKNKQNEVIGQLNAKEKELRDELVASRKAADRLEKLITDLIEEERRRIANAAENTATKLTAEGASISTAFAANKSKLNWPVENGFISGKFGKQPHPVLKGVVVDNLGINIQTKQGEEVRAVYDGEVMPIASIPGLNKVVVIQHGDYATVYANLSKVLVKPGQQVKAKQPLGVVYTDKDGTSELNFQIWQNTERLNPQPWLNSR